MKKSLLIFGLGVIVFFSCQHKPIIITEPTVTITPPDPIEGSPPSYFINGNTVQILFDFSDADELTNASVLLKYNSPTTGSDTAVFYFEPDVTGLKSYTIDTLWVVNGITTGVDATLTGTATNKSNLTTSIDYPIELVPF